jgi:hypothetical protein
VLSLLLLIIALVIATVFLVRYLRTRSAVSSPSPTSLFHQPLDQLDLAGVIQVVRGNSVNLLRVGPHASG